MEYKSRFIEIPSYYPVPDGQGHWISRDRLAFYSARFDCTMWVSAGSVNDLASIPRLFHRIFSPNGPHRPAAALHDKLFELKGRIPNSLNRAFTLEECNLMMFDAMRVSKRDFYMAYPKDARKKIDQAKVNTSFDSDNPLVTDWVAYPIFWGLQIGSWVEWNKQ